MSEFYTKLVKRKSHDVEVVSMDTTNQTSTDGLDPISSSLVPIKVREMMNDLQCRVRINVYAIEV